ncbi:MAG TPA: Fic family protein [Candidatus Eisenbacteria bacterium]|nr:Fic family protein [Candidatus Eisenbacteria bacterium]
MYSPKYTITNTILRNIGLIEAAKQVIDSAPLLPYYEKKFRDDAMVRAVHYGTHIEGNELSLNQAEKVLSGQVINARDRDIQEVLNYRKVMEEIGQFQISNLKFQIDEEFIRKLHKMTVDKILPDVQSGNYRTSPVVIKNSRSGDVVFKPPLPEEVTRQMSDFIAFINSMSNEDIHPILKSGIVHYEFVRIHPFTDGNGRVARALSTLILFLEGYDIRQFFSLEEYFDKDALSYYEALQSVEKNFGELTHWLEYFTHGLAVELGRIRERVEHVSVDNRLKQKLGGKPMMLTDRQLRIVEYIQETGFLQNQAFKNLFPMISEDAVLLDLKELVKSGLIKKTGSTKGAKYIMA